ncbi:MAG: protein translocase subunit SecF [Arenicella sp.]
MEIFNKQTKINFLGWRKVAAVISTVLIVIGVGSYVQKGLNLGIDFTGGTLIEVGYSGAADIEGIRTLLNSEGYEKATVQNFGSAKDVMIRVPLTEDTSSAGLSEEIVKVLKKSDENVELRRVEFVGPQFGKELVEKGSLALLYALGLVMIYVAVRFEWKFGIGSVAALVHDVLVTVGAFAVLQMEFSLPVLAAVLAVIGYSLNDTIVVFDRIRENFRKLRETDTVEIMNVSVNQTLPRTILTSVTTMLVLLALFFFGGEVLRGFSVALIIGVLVGTYSSIFIASPVVLALGVSKDDLIPEKVEKEGADQPDVELLP